MRANIHFRPKNNLIHIYFIYMKNQHNNKREWKKMQLYYHFLSHSLSSDNVLFLTKQNFKCKVGRENDDQIAISSLSSSTHIVIFNLTCTCSLIIKYIYFFTDLSQFLLYKLYTMTFCSQYFFILALAYICLKMSHK
jgi:hypothetical protein